MELLVALQSLDLIYKLTIVSVVVHVILMKVSKSVYKHLLLEVSWKIANSFDNVFVCTRIAIYVLWAVAAIKFLIWFF